MRGEGARRLLAVVHERVVVAADESGKLPLVRRNHGDYMRHGALTKRLAVVEECGPTANPEPGKHHVHHGQSRARSAAGPTRPRARRGQLSRRSRLGGRAQARAVECGFERAKRDLDLRDTTALAELSSCVRALGRGRGRGRSAQGGGRKEALLFFDEARDLPLFLLRPVLPRVVCEVLRPLERIQLGQLLLGGALGPALHRRVATRLTRRVEVQRHLGSQPPAQLRAAIATGRHELEEADARPALGAERKVPATGRAAGRTLWPRSTSVVAGHQGRRLV
mmetsp:Transcript_16069/g.37186  ORF Transcript_16069/g.37186 Transcript_16069/m.37186 type:complete len:280 (+) Transcript_16069:466-1305(+)